MYALFFSHLGLGGSTRLVDIGGIPYLLPLVDKSKRYDLAEVARLAGLPGAFLLGAGAGSAKVAGVNCEVSCKLLTLNDVPCDIPKGIYV